MPEHPADLAKSIAEEGLLDLITVDAKGRIIDGRNRAAAHALPWAALKHAKTSDDRPAVRVSEGDEAAVISLVIARNLHRRHLTPEQEGAAYQKADARLPGRRAATSTARKKGRGLTFLRETAHARRIREGVQHARSPPCGGGTRRSTKRRSRSPHPRRCRRGSPSRGRSHPPGSRSRRGRRQAGADHRGAGAQARQGSQRRSDGHARVRRRGCRGQARQPLDEIRRLTWNQPRLSEGRPSLFYEGRNSPTPA